ncbi:hypothetical protein AOQ84DRAFT_417558 [Glonium stellatum]|uniref:Uncharacterized protein n=1 Tax=Glonium stellatum TaxID=574774 RepID=A0A8E2JXM4_9PEZI|nr:hypothetical protein AOQ84DRAFT_417558 [Glonium stellatum]
MNSGRLEDESKVFGHRDEQVNPSQSSPSVERQNHQDKPSLLDLATPSKFRRSEKCFSSESVFGLEVEVIDLTSDEPSPVPYTPTRKHTKTSRSVHGYAPSLMGMPDTPTHHPSSVLRDRKRDLSPSPSKSRNVRFSRAIQATQISSAATYPGLAFKTQPLRQDRYSSATSLSRGPPRSLIPAHASYSKSPVSTSRANPFTSSLSESSSKASPLRAPGHGSSELIPFDLKTSTWTPWKPREYSDLSCELLGSFDYNSFAARHNRSPADVLAVFQAMVIRPLRQEVEAKKRGESGIAELLALFRDHGTVLRTWAQGSGYEIDGKLEDIFRGEVVVVGESAIGKGPRARGGTNMLHKREKERVVIPIQVLSAEDWQYLNLHILNEGQKELLGKPKRRLSKEVERDSTKRDYDVKLHTSKKTDLFPKTDDIMMMLDDNATQTAEPKNSTTPPGSPRVSSSRSSKTKEELTETIRDDLDDSPTTLFGDETVLENSHLFDKSGKVKRFSFSGTSNNSLFMDMPNELEWLLGELAWFYTACSAALFSNRTRSVSPALGGARWLEAPFGTLSV